MQDRLLYSLLNRLVKLRSILVAIVSCACVAVFFVGEASFQQVANVSAKDESSTNTAKSAPESIVLADNINQLVYPELVTSTVSTSNSIEPTVSDSVLMVAIDLPNEAIINAQQVALSAADKAQKERRFIKGEEEKRLLVPFQSEMKRQKNIFSQEREKIAKSTTTPIVQLDVPIQYQKPQLPNGCEVTSLAMVLNFYGFDIRNTALSDKFLPKRQLTYQNKKRYGASPDTAFCGNPSELKSSFYCFINPLVNATANYFKAIGESKLIPHDITGADESELVNELNSGNPVITITTLSLGEAMQYAPARWIISDTGEVYTPYLNLHCVVVCGYDEENFYLADPIEGSVICKRKTFMKSYTEMGSRAMVINESP